MIEIWNNVFIQYNREADGSLRPLPDQHVDTGMGFERLTSILQNVDSNYDTDIFQPLFAVIQQITGARPYAGKVGPEDEPEYIDMAYRVVADHIRTLCFAIADGAVPSNKGRGYVLLRVLRRAVRYGRQNLGADLGFFSKLVPELVRVMGGTFPELKERQEHITEIIRKEEEKFSETLDKGILKFKELANKSDKMLSGDDAFFLYSTMGFPIDLTELMAEEVGLAIDKEGFEAKMAEDAQKSKDDYERKKGGGSGKDLRMVAEQTSYLIGKSVPATDDSAKYVWNKTLEGCSVKAVFLGRNETEDNIGFVDSISPENGAVGIILDKTSFYAESGGQIFDTGTITTESGVLKVNNVQIYGQFVLHVGMVESGSLRLGESASCSVDYLRRAPIASNHTMTHILNFALRQVLIVQPEKETGEKVKQLIDQKGSLVDDSKLRFDFSWSGPLTREQLSAVEQMCSHFIEREVPVQSYVASLAQAEQISGLRAVFGEKYPDPVRVVAVSKSEIPEMLANPQDAQWNDASIEFCGGTHMGNTKEAEAFILLSEEGIAQGIRRITAVTMLDAKESIQVAGIFEAKLKVADTLTGPDLENMVKVLGTELNTLQISAIKKGEFRDVLTGLTKRVMAHKKEQAAALSTKALEMAIVEAEKSSSDKVAIRFDFGTDGKLAKAIATKFCKKIKDKSLLLVSADAEGDRCLVMSCAPKGVETDCKAWVTNATEGLDAKGGGKKDMATFQLSGAGNADAIVSKAKA